MFRFLPLLLIPRALPASAAMYKCRIDGESVYTDRACDGGEIVETPEPPATATVPCMVCLTGMISPLIR